MELLLIRGIPGSGKTTIAKKYVDKWYKHYEADMFFVDKEGKYNFDSSSLGLAHEWCQVNAAQSLRAGHNVVVANTFIKEISVYAYVEMAHKYGAELRIIEATDGSGSIHNVPDQTIENMKSSYLAQNLFSSAAFKYYDNLRKSDVDIEEH